MLIYLKSCGSGVNFRRYQGFGVGGNGVGNGCGLLDFKPAIVGRHPLFHPPWIGEDRRGGEKVMH